MAAHPPLAVQVAKAFVNRDAVGGLAESVEATALLFATPEHRAGAAAFRAGAGTDRVMRDCRARSCW